MCSIQQRKTDKAPPHSTKTYPCARVAVVFSPQLAAVCCCTCVMLVMMSELRKISSNQRRVSQSPHRCVNSKEHFHWKYILPDVTS